MLLHQPFYKHDEGRERGLQHTHYRGVGDRMGTRSQVYTPTPILKGEIMLCLLTFLANAYSNGCIFNNGSKKNGIEVNVRLSFSRSSRFQFLKLDVCLGNDIKHFFFTISICVSYKQSKDIKFGLRVCDC